ncbi:SDR family NAD(P)-dependent oxidoreductase [Paenibacillus sp. H1-7]|uniref:SDR family NAD(P)-dependent oxidoreductase n=1 Tax=Paenibacillus sp. H1-7 TaxID=2282849 RepID=UPI001EF75D81|nr:glucose 1-dehydrogenase [Paenibacillus sp. H1-7]ULL15636.1 SDR family NAD(P)-dependent oxidoreductase [Paenibacillus sp. H1-7]
MPRLEGKVAVITGAAMGQGAAEARLFAREGAKVVATDLQLEKLEQVVAEIQAEGGQAIAVKHNVASEEDWKHVIEEGVRAFGKIDILINNAGISTDQTLDNLTMENWNKVMDINLTGAVLGMKLVVPEMRKAGGGSIVNISSVAGIVAMNRTNGYTASKGALRVLSKSAAAELAKDYIRVNSVHPGVIETPMTVKEIANEQVKGWFQAETMLPRLGTADDIAYGVLYLASDEASFVTGAELVIDGGWIAK